LEEVEGSRAKVRYVLFDVTEEGGRFEELINR
jgi:hypothetical protein